MPRRAAQRSISRTLRLPLEPADPADWLRAVVRVVSHPLVILDQHSQVMAVSEAALATHPQLAPGQRVDLATLGEQPVRVEPLDHGGGPRGWVVSWATVTAAAPAVQPPPPALGEASRGLESAERTTLEAGEVAQACGQLKDHVEHVAAATEGLSHTLRALSQRATESAAVARAAGALTDSAKTRMAVLSQCTRSINDATRFITSIAEHTHLLALNATIESTRAGAAGAGFAVVASEVKSLARESAQSANEIEERLTTLRAETTATCASIEELSNVMQQLLVISNGIAQAVEQQAGSLKAIAGNSDQASGALRLVTNASQRVLELANTTVDHARATFDAVRPQQEPGGHTNCPPGQATS
ncbi:MAG: methyl-accepting chemotaxis protein [Myxococcaceae bacterium]